MKKNYALPGNPNETLDRKLAVEYLVDCCLNVEETEWAACSVKHNPKNKGLADIEEVAVLSFVKVDEKMLNEVYDTVKENAL